jgi:hypothetical protein
MLYTKFSQNMSIRSLVKTVRLGPVESVIYNYDNIDVSMSILTKT